MSAPVVRTHLELDDLALLRPAPPPRLDGVRIERAGPDGALSRRLYVEVGGPHDWVDHLQRSEAGWQAWAQRVETWIARVEGEDAGYYELLAAHPRPGDVEIAYFGLLARFQGRGLGGWLLTHAVRRALELGSRVWLNTCTLDGPAALPNYRARGLRPFRVDVRHPPTTQQRTAKDLLGSD
jgi:GNAT superfamily N-acetyltransferase